MLDRMTRADRRKAEWMGQFEDNVIAMDPSKTGKIDWLTATFFFNQGLSPWTAADRATSKDNE